MHLMSFRDCSEHKYIHSNVAVEVNTLDICKMTECWSFLSQNYIFAEFPKSPEESSRGLHLRSLCLPHSRIFALTTCSLPFYPISARCVRAFLPLPLSYSHSRPEMFLLLLQTASSPRPRSLPTNLKFILHLQTSSYLSPSASRLAQFIPPFKRQPSSREAARTPPVFSSFFVVHDVLLVIRPLPRRLRGVLPRPARPCSAARPTRSPPHRPDCELLLDSQLRLQYRLRVASSRHPGRLSWYVDRCSALCVRPFPRSWHADALLRPAICSPSSSPSPSLRLKSQCRRHSPSASDQIQAA